MDLEDLTETIGILYPVIAVWCLRTRRIRVDVIKDHVSPVLDIDAPELRLYNVEILNSHIGYVPKHEWHRPTWTRGPGRLSHAGVRLAMSNVWDVSIHNTGSQNIPLEDPLSPHSTKAVRYR